VSEALVMTASDEKTYLTFIYTRRIKLIEQVIPVAIAIIAIFDFSAFDIGSRLPTTLVNDRPE
jgi:hypothetical protein